MSGDTLPAYCSAAGTSEVPFERRTPHTLTDRGKLLAELSQVRLQSLAVAEDEMEIGTEKAVE